MIILELFNTAFERYIDIVTPERRPEVGAVKDIMAGAVLLAVVLSVVVGVFIFIGPVTDAVKKMLGL